MSDKPRFKVAVLLPSLQVGGAERLVLEGLSFMNDDPRFHFELHLVFERGAFFEKATSLGVPVHVWNAPHKSIRMLKTYVDIIRYLRRTHCDILHSHLLNSIGPIVGRVAGVRVIHTVHSDVPYGFGERFILGRSNLILACGNKVLQNIRRFIPPEKVRLLKNAIHAPGNKFYKRENVFKTFGIKESSKLVLSLGRFIRQKGFDLLIGAFPRVISDIENAVLLIGGDGLERERLNDMVQAMNLRDHVRLPGIISNTDEVMAVCDLYVNSSRFEGLPITLLEAMAHGKPIVATSVGGNPEVVQDGVTGFLVPPEDPEKLAKAIVKMLGDDTFRDQAGKAAYTLFIKEYRIEKHCETLAQYYLQVMQDKK